MNWLTIMACLLQGLFEFTDAQCQFSPPEMVCEGVDSEGFLHGFYENMDLIKFIKISGGNWRIIDYFPTPFMDGEYYTIISLAINDASIQQIDGHAFENLRSLSSLDLSHNQLETTPFIEYLPRFLRKLNLSRNKIAHVASFTHLYLSHLDMSNNRIQSLDIRNVITIRELDFSRNNIDSLLHLDTETYDDEFEQSMNLSNNKITEFKEIEYGQNFHSLDLSFNNLSVVELAYEKRFLNLSNCNISNFSSLNDDQLRCTEVDFSQFHFGTTLKNNLYVTKKLKIQVERNSNLTDVTTNIRELVDRLAIVDLSYSSITNIPTEAFRDFHQNSLILSNMNISELDGFTFQSSSLDLLDLSNSHIQILRPNVFHGLTSHVINLSFNEISDIKNVFHDVGAQKIDLSFNALRTIGNNSFESCDILFEIILSNCLIERIEPLAFIKLGNLRILDLSNNKLLILERKAFHDLPMIELYLGGNRIATIRSTAFSNLPRLESLNLSSIHLHNLEMNAFVNLPRFESVNLSHNYINIIPQQLFVNTPRLRTIDFTYNNISTSTMFSNELKITNLSLSINGTLTPNKISNLNMNYFALENSRIETLEANCFQGLYNLKELHFKNSDIRFVRFGTLNGLYNLRYLDSQNLFRHIPNIEMDTFRDLRSLQTLNLSGLSIQTIESNSFRGLSNIQEMLLSKNDLGRLNEDTFVGLYNLKVLDLSFNHIGEIDKDVFNPLRNLEELYLQHNVISSIEPTYFKNMNCLRKLRLDHNEIAHLAPDCLLDLRNLQGLHLGSNKLSSWRVGVFQHLTNLSVLNLSRNKLKTFEIGAFHNLASLTVLDLTETSLNECDEVAIFSSMRNVKQLFLNRNYLKSLDYKLLLLNLKNIEYIGIAYNEWQCKDLLLMIQYFKNKNIKYEPKFPEYVSDNIDGVACNYVCENLNCDHEYVKSNDYQ